MNTLQLGVKQRLMLVDRLCCRINTVGNERKTVCLATCDVFSFTSVVLFRIYFGIIFTRYFKEFQSASMAKTYDTMVIPCFGHGITMVIYYFFFVSEMCFSLSSGRCQMFDCDREDASIKT